MHINLLIALRFTSLVGLLGNAEEDDVRKYRLESPVACTSAGDDFGTAPWKTLTSLPVDMNAAEAL